MCRGTHKASAHDHVVSSIEAGRREVIVGLGRHLFLIQKPHVMHFKAFQRVEVVFGPLPGVAHGVMMTTGRSRHGIHRALRGLGDTAKKGPKRGPDVGEVRVGEGESIATCKRKRLK